MRLSSEPTSPSPPGTRAAPQSENADATATATTTPVTPPAPRPQSKLQTTIVILTLGATLFLVALDVTIVSTIVPTIANEFRSSLGYTWVASAYLLANAAFVPTWGKVSDIFGRRAVLMVSVGVFWVGSLLCGVANSVGMLIAGRAVQGVGAGGVVTLVYVCISDLFSLRERGLYFGAMGMVWVVASATGPVLGGVFTSAVTWRWCFYVNLPICGAGLAVLPMVLNLHNPRTPIREGLAAIDWIGSLTVVSGTLLFLLGLEFGGSIYPWASTTVVCLLVFGVATLGAASIYIYRFSRYPVVPPHLFRNRSNCAAFAASFFHGFVLISASYWLPLYFQAVLGASPLQSGLYLLPYTLSLSVTSAIAGWIMKATGQYLPLIIGAMAVTALGFGLLIDLGPDMNLCKIVMYQLVAGIGIGPNSQAVLVAIQTTVEPKDIAAATSTFVFMRQMATAISIVVGGVVLNDETTAASGPNSTDTLSGGNTATDPPWIADLPGDRSAAAHEAYHTGLRRMRIVYAAFAGAGLLSSLFIGRARLSQEHEEHRTGLATLRDKEKQRTAG